MAKDEHQCPGHAPLEPVEQDGSLRWRCQLCKRVYRLIICSDLDAPRVDGDKTRSSFPRLAEVIGSAGS